MASRQQLLVVAVTLSVGCGGAAIGGSPQEAPARWRFGSTNIFETSGHVSNVVRCHHEAFLAEPGRGQIRRIDLNVGREGRAIKVDAQPHAVAVDCDQQRLYVVGYRPGAKQPGAQRRSVVGVVVAYELATGESVHTFEVPDMSEVQVTSASLTRPHHLYVSGLWHRGPGRLRDRPSETFFEESRLGLLLALDTGTVEPGLEPYDPACLGSAGPCLDVSYAVGGAGWVNAQPTSTRIAVRAARAAPPRFIDVRTPKFVRTGDRLAPNAGAEAGVRWSAANSTIWRVFSFSRHVAVVHVRTQLPPDYVFGQQVGFHTLMNVYATDGTLLQADVELADLAVGQDEGGVFVVQYDRARNASSAATLLHVPVP